jgi:hypothetical protein
MAMPRVRTTPAAICLILAALSIMGAQGKQFPCKQFSADLQNDEFALKEVKNIMVEEPHTQFDLR